MILLFKKGMLKNTSSCIKDFLAHFLYPSKKNPPCENFIIFREIELCCSNIREILIFPRSNSLVTIQKNGTFSQKKAHLIFSQMKTCTFHPKLKKKKKKYWKKISYTPGNRDPPKIIIFLSKEKLFMNFRKLDICQVVTCCARKSNIFYIFPYEEANFYKLKYFLVIFIKYFFDSIIFFSRFFAFSRLLLFIFWEISVTFMTILFLFLLL